MGQITEAFKEGKKEIKSDYKSMISESVLDFAVKNFGVKKAYYFTYIPGVKFSNLSPGELASMVVKQGIQSINLFSETDLKFNQVPPFDIATIVEGLGIKSIDPLKNAGANFTGMTKYNNYLDKAYDNGLVTRVVEVLGVESIKALSDAGVNFNDLEASEVKPIIKTLGADSIPALLDAGVKQEVIDSATDKPLKANEPIALKNCDAPELGASAEIIGGDISHPANIVGTQLSAEAKIMHGQYSVSAMAGADNNVVPVQVAEDIIHASGISFSHSADVEAIKLDDVNDLGEEEEKEILDQYNPDLEKGKHEEEEVTSDQQHSPELAHHNYMLQEEL